MLVRDKDGTAYRYRLNTDSDDRLAHGAAILLARSANVEATVARAESCCRALSLNLVLQTAFASRHLILELGIVASSPEIPAAKLLSSTDAARPLAIQLRVTWQTLVRIVVDNLRIDDVNLPHCRRA
jgi:hypothetical protein